MTTAKDRMAKRSGLRTERHMIERHMKVETPLEIEQLTQTKPFYFRGTLFWMGFCNSHRILQSQASWKKAFMGERYTPNTTLSISTWEEIWFWETLADYLSLSLSLSFYLFIHPKSPLCTHAETRM